MEKRAWMGFLHPGGKLFFTVLIAFFSLFVIVSLSILIAIPVFGVSPSELFAAQSRLTEPGNIALGRYLQIMSHLGMFIIPSIALAWFFSRNIKNYLFLSNTSGSRALFLSAIAIFAAVPFIGYVLEWNMNIQFPEWLSGAEEWMRRSEESAERLTKAFLEVDTLQGLLFNIFMIAVIPAIGEEFMFRGVLLRIFREWTASTHLAIWITAIIFSAIHMQFFGFFPRLILGALFGYMVAWTGSIWPAILAHFLNNAAAVISYYLFSHKLTDEALENLWKGPQALYYAAFSLVITLIIMWLIKKYRNPNPEILS